MALVKDTLSRFPHTKVAVSSDEKSGELWSVSDKSTLVSGAGNLMRCCHLESRTKPDRVCSWPS